MRPKFTPDYQKAVQVGTIQTVVGRMEKMGYWDSDVCDSVLWVPDLIVIDEAHRSLAPTYLRILRNYTEAWCGGDGDTGAEESNPCGCCTSTW